MIQLFFRLLVIACSSYRATAMQIQELTPLHEALAKLDTGIDLLEHRSPYAKQTILEAAADIQSVIDQHGIQSASAYHALGNAYMLTQNHAQAVLAFRRGEQINPMDRRLRDSLAFAREQTAIQVIPTTPNRIVALLMSWRGTVPRAMLWAGFASCFTLSWFVLIARSAFSAPRWFVALAAWTLTLALIPLTALWADWKIYQGQDAVVLMQGNTIARSGPDDSIYDPVYAEPLDAGTEAVVVEERNQWSRLTLADGSECWVPTELLARVNP